MARSQERNKRCGEMESVSRLATDGTTRYGKVVREENSSGA